MRKLSKSGEGARGGHVIGHSPSTGKPIYAANHAHYAGVHGAASEGRDSMAEASHMAHAVHTAYSGADAHMTVKDHMHASELHTEHAGLHGTTRAQSHRAAHAHATAALVLQHRQSVANHTGKSARWLADGDLRKSDLSGPIPTYDPARDPNGTDVSQLRYQRGEAMCVDDGLNDLIIATIKSQADLAKPQASQYRKVDPVYTAGRVNGT